MYSDRRYSLARYSVNQETKTVEIAERFSETVGALAGAAVPVDFRGRYREAVQGSAQGTISVISRLLAASGLFTAAKMSADVLTDTAFSGGLRAAVYGQKNTSAVLAALDNLSSRSWASKNIPMSFVQADVLSARAAGSKDIWASFQGAEVLTSLQEATSQTTERTDLQVTVPPGGELRIDSELFTVLLNGENALHTQSGDWINVSRQLLRITIESAFGGQLQGQLIYTERYL